tara:strand:+ start:335 stop:835 length:501 start_codon:yes stop_codon:yes gene_type:complete
MYEILHCLKRSLREIIFVVGIIVLIPFLFIEINGSQDQARTAGATIMVALYWVFEVFQLPVTSILPMLLFPTLGILSAKVVSPLYFTDTIALFFATNIVALAMEKYRLHERLALKVLIAIGNRPRLLLLGIMLETALLSCFMSNTGTKTELATIIFFFDMYTISSI